MSSQTRTEKIFENIRIVKEKIRAAAGRSGRNPEAVELIIVTKYAPVEDIAALMNCGQTAHTGESRVQDAEKKWTSAELSPFRKRTAMHMIGHLQTNKAGKAADFFDWVDSVDSLRLALALDRRASELGKIIPILMQVKLTSSPSQSGVGLKEVSGLLEEVRKLKNLSPRGYMGIAPVCDNPEELRPVFKEVKRIFDRDFPSAETDEKRYLSLGMSEDFETAVEEGSNLPRIGSMIFR